MSFRVEDYDANLRRKPVKTSQLMCERMVIAMAFNPTKSQRLAIDAPTEGTTVVSAAAGSGKTAVLTERVIKKITDPENPVDADRLLVVTFTNAAAAEMRQRISDRLSAEIAQSPRNIKLVRQQMLLTKANICTIDAFCRSLAAEHFEKAGINPEIRLMSPGQNETVLKNAMEKTLEHFYKEEEERFFALCDVMGGQNGDYSLSAAVRSLYHFLRALPFPEEWMDETYKMYSEFTSPEESFFGKTLMTYANGLLNRTISSLEAVRSDMLDDQEIFAARSEAVDNDILSLGRMLKALNGGDWDAFRLSLQGYEKTAFSGRLPKGHNEALKERVKDVHNAAAKAVSDLNRLFTASAGDCRALASRLSDSIGLLLDCVRCFARCCEEEKRRIGVMDFADIEYAALHILVRREKGKTLPSETAMQICDGIDEVLVDEYQDTNDLQSAIFEALSNGGEKLFVVGDVKQSIYRFRQANPEIFANLLNAGGDSSGGGDNRCVKKTKKITLAQNFRSRSGVCGIVNFIFRLIMTPAVGGVDYSLDHSLVPAGIFPGRKAADAALHIIEQADGDITKIQAEADHIAGIIKDMMSRACVTDSAAGGLRRAKYGDFAILLRGAKNKAAEYADVLKSHGIPAVTEQKGDFFQSAEIKKAAALLKVIDNPRDEVALLSAMLSPMFGFEAEDAAKLRNRCKNQPLYSALDTVSAEDGRFAGFKAQLERLRCMAVYLTPAELLQNIYDETGYIAAVQAMENGELRRANLMGLVTLAEEYETVGYKGLSGFIRYLDAAGQGNISISLPDSAARDAVKIMTIHHSKGLQFPVCFVADCGGDINRQDARGTVLLDRNAGIGMMVNDSEGRKSTTFMRSAASICIERASISEELRILYVAMTRAIDNLFLLFTCNSLKTELKAAADILNVGYLNTGEPLDPINVLKTKNVGRLLCACAMLHPDGTELRTLSALEVRPETCDAPFEIKIIGSRCAEDETNGEDKHEVSEIQPAWTKEDIDRANQLSERLHQRLSFKYPYSALNSVAAKQSVSQLIQKEQELEYSFNIPEFMNNGRLTAAKKGTAMHEFLRYADLDSAACGLEDEIRRLTAHERITKQQADSLDRQKLMNFMRSGLYARLLKSHWVKRELKFIYELPARALDPALPENAADEPVVIQGTVDCAFIEDGKLVIADYKTGDQDEKYLTETYAPQLNIYAEALESVYKIPVAEKLLYSFALDTQITIR